MIIIKPLLIRQPEAGKLIREMRAHVNLTQEQLIAFGRDLLHDEPLGKRSRKPVPASYTKN